MDKDDILTLCFVVAFNTGRIVSPTSLGFTEDEIKDLNIKASDIAVKKLIEEGFVSETPVDLN